MKSISQVRQAYEDNYREIQTIIDQMGGNDRIKFHRKKQSTLYRQLKDLQRREHYLDELENRMHNYQTAVH